MKNVEDVDRGCCFKIKLDFSPSIGESWVLKYFDDQYVKFKKTEMIQATRPGGIAYVLFTFKAKRETRNTIIVFDKTNKDEVLSTEKFNIRIVDRYRYNTNMCCYNPCCYNYNTNMCCYNPCYNRC